MVATNLSSLVAEYLNEDLTTDWLTVPPPAGLSPRLCLDDRFTSVLITEECVVLVSDGEETTVLELALAADVVRHLDGNHTAEEIAELLRDQHEAELVHLLLLGLQKHGIVRMVRPSGEGHRPLYWDGAEYVAETAETLCAAWKGRGRANTVRVSCAGHDDVQPVEVLLTEDYTSPDLRPDLFSSQVVLVKPGYRRIWVGPVMTPGRGPCIACLQERLRLNLAAPTLLHNDEVTRAGEVVRPRIDREYPQLTWFRIALTLMNMFGPGRKSGSGHWIEAVELEKCRTERHPVVRLPQCAFCGDPDLDVNGPQIQLRGRPVRSRMGGGTRILEPGQTLRRLSALVSPLTGVVRHVRQVPVEATPLVHVYTASHARHYGPPNLRTVRNSRRDSSGGKGIADIDARVSALCESLERFSAVHRGSERCRIAPASELGATAIAPNDLLLFSTRQFATRDEWNARDASGMHWVPERYDDQPIEWSQVRSLTTGASRFVPSASVFLGFHGEGQRFCKGDSNGLASGNCLEEAVLQAFFELVERDAIAIWWYNRLPRPAVDARSFEHRWIDRLIEYYTRIQRPVWILDLTTDLQIPCFAAVSALEGHEREDIILGFGAHLDARVALIRALTELNQMLPTVQRTTDERRRQLMPDFVDAIEWWETARLVEHPYLSPAAQEPSAFGDFARPAVTDLRDAVLDCAARACAAGSDLLVHDLTRPDVRFPVVRVIAPGLRHFWRRLGPGRLYDVPVRMGWLDQPRTEPEMNPVSMFV